MRFFISCHHRAIGLLKPIHNKLPMIQAHVDNQTLCSHRSMVLFVHSRTAPLADELILDSARFDPKSMTGSQTRGTTRRFARRRFAANEDMLHLLDDE